MTVDCHIIIGTEEMESQFCRPKGEGCSAMPGHGSELSDSEAFHEAAGQSRQVSCAPPGRRLADVTQVSTATGRIDTLIDGSRTIESTSQFNRMTRESP
jgi:hypothetical protein